MISNEEHLQGSSTESVLSSISEKPPSGFEDYTEKADWNPEPPHDQADATAHPFESDDVVIPAGILKATNRYYGHRSHNGDEEKAHPRQVGLNEDFDIVDIARNQKQQVEKAWSSDAEKANFEQWNQWETEVEGQRAQWTPGDLATLQEGAELAPTTALPRRSVRISNPGRTASTNSVQHEISRTTSDNEVHRELSRTSSNRSALQALTALPAHLHNDAVVYQPLHGYTFNGNSETRHRALSESVAPDVAYVGVLGDPFKDRHWQTSESGQNTTDSQLLTTEPTVGSEKSRLPSGIGPAVQKATQRAASVVRRDSLVELYEKAKLRGQHLQRKKWVQVTFEYFCYLLILCFIYFVLVGRPIWNGTVWWVWWVVDHKFTIAGTWSITIGLALFYAYAPLLILFEKEPPMPAPDAAPTQDVSDTALLIPCYKAAQLIGPTLVAALHIFPAKNIFVIANGNSPTPLDNTEEICQKYNVNHVWSPVGSKIVAQYVGCYAAKGFKNVLLIDDDCALPPNFPIVNDRLTDMIKCIGYTIKSVGPPENHRGTLCQQAQDLEYKISGLQRALAGKIGSATFPHGAISLWDTKFLIDTFREHPGFSVSEDWFFGHTARKLGSRITMCSAVFVETETPDSIFFSKGSRGGFGEMTIFKQRFYRWNFFFVNGMYYNLAYILGSWKLGFWEFGAKLFVFQEFYETLLYLLAPFVLPISLVVRPLFCVYLLLATIGMYYLNVTIFNEIHLRRRNERVGWVCVYVYYTPYKIILTFVNVFSCYYSLYKYAKYFAKRHPKIIEDEKAVEVVLRLEESTSKKAAEQGQGRRLTVTAVGARLSLVPEGNPRTSVIGTRLSWAPSRNSRASVASVGVAPSNIAVPSLAHFRSRSSRRTASSNGDERVPGSDLFNGQLPELKYTNSFDFAHPQRRP